jgi:hypothetical protein
VADPEGGGWVAVAAASGIPGVLARADADPMEPGEIDGLIGTVEVLDARAQNLILEATED